jgi:hypothetical protein
MMKRIVQSLMSKVQGRRQTGVALLLLGLWTLDLGLWTKPTFAAFEDIGTGARPTAMGGTYVAVGDDVQSLMYNPAGLAQLRMQEISSEYSRLYTGLTDGSNIGQYFLGYGRPVRYGGTIGIGIKQLSLDSLYSERTISLGYGEWITETVAAGLAFKQLHHEFEAPNISVDDNGNVTQSRPTFFSQYGNSSTAYSADLGLLWRRTARQTIGFAIQDINEPNVALNPNDHEIVPRTIRLGNSYKANRGWLFAASLTSKKSLANERDSTITGALEKWWHTKDQGSFAARSSLATGSREFQQMTMGAGYRFGQLQIDYAFVFNLSGITLGDTSGTHRFSFGYRFGTMSKPTVRIASKSKKPAKTVAKRPQEPPAIDTMPELERPSVSAQPQVRPVAGEQITHKTPAPYPTATHPTVPLEEPVVETTDTAETAETNETAEMMRTAPKPEPAASHATEPGPGISLAVPAPEREVVPTVPKVVGRIESPVRLEATPAPMGALNRVQFLEFTKSMTEDYADRTATKEAADVRLGAFVPLYSGLKAYTLSRSELLDQFEEGDKLDRLAKQYENLAWNGASASQRLKHLTRSLETTLVPALADRPWDTQDLRDRRYKAWLDTALADGKKLIARDADAHSRLMYWKKVVEKAISFENEPKQPVAPKPVAPVVKPVPAKPAPAAASRGLEKDFGQALSDGEWVYRVKAGDTLISLAKRYYADYNRWRDIYILNEDRLGRGGNLRPGQLLRMPKKARD